jgi:hypothetical protein
VSAGAQRISLFCRHNSHADRRAAIMTMVRDHTGRWDEAPDISHRLKMASGRAPRERSLPAPSFRIVEHNGERYLLWSFVCDLDSRHNLEVRQSKLDAALDTLAGAGVSEASLPLLAATLQRLAGARPGA